MCKYRTYNPKTASSARVCSVLLSFLLASLLLVLGACASGGKQGDVYGGLGQASDPVPFMAAARRGILPNGLSYYILENARPENRAFLTLAVNAGSVLEQDHEQGLAHFVEHMAFNGTARFPEAELIDYLRSLGMRFGPEVNAYTSFDETVYGIEVPVEPGDDGIKRIPDKALAVIDDWTYAITFDPKDVDDERPIIMEEYRSGLGANERIRRKMLPVIFRDSAYEHRLPIGLPEIIQNAPASTLENFYKTWYRPDNMALILVGDFDGPAMEAQLASHFSAPAPETPLTRPYYELPDPRKGSLEAHVFTDPEYSSTRIDLYYKRPPQALRGDLASFRQGLIDNLIGRMLEFRFEEAAVKQESPYLGAGAWEARFGKASRYYTMAVIAKSGLAKESLQALLLEKERISRYGFTSAEIERNKRALISDLRRMVSEKDRQHSNGYVSSFTQHFLEDQHTADLEWQLDAAIKLLPGISAGNIAAAVKDYFAGDDLRVIVSASEGELASLPSEADIRLAVAQSRRARIARPKEPAVAGSSLLRQVPLPGAVTGESEDDETGTIRWDLDNGATVLLKQTANKNNEIVFYALARGGITGAGSEDIVSARLAAEIIGASGAGSYTRTELLRRLADKQIALSFWMRPFYRGFQGSSTAEDLQTFFELLHLNFTQPRVDPDAAGAILDQYRTALARRGENPETVFVDELTRTAWNNNPYFNPLETADIAKADAGRALALVKRGLNPADYTFVFTGNLDLAQVRDYVETFLASIPPSASWDTWDDAGVSRPAGGEKTITMGREEKSQVYQGWFLAEPYTDAGAAAASVLSEYLDIVLIGEIREKRGGVYSVSISVSHSFLPGRGELVMENYFSCDPRRAEELSMAIREEIQRVSGGVNGETFAKSVAALKKSYEQSMESNLYIARNLANGAVLYDAPPGRIGVWPSLYDAVRPADIEALARRLMEQTPLRMILYPENWTGSDR